VRGLRIAEENGKSLYVKAEDLLNWGLQIAREGKARKKLGFL
jgi:hypothetical protein